MFIGVVVQYVRPKQTVYVRETLQTAIRSLVDSGEEVDLEADPSAVSLSIQCFKEIVTISA